MVRNRPPPRKEKIDQNTMNDAVALVKSGNFSDLESDDSDKLPDIGELPKEGTLQINQFILVLFEVKQSHYFYVGKVIEILENDELQVSYLRKSQKYEGKFVYPPVPDIDVIKKSDIFAFLPNPVINTTTTSRLRSLVTFPIMLNKEIR